MSATLPRSSFDFVPLALVPLLALAAWPLIGSSSSWLTLTVAGLAMGMIVFIVASGLTLVFGLMDVLNFGHGVFIAFGAFIATSVLGGLADWTGADSLWLNLAALFPAMLAAMARALGDRVAVMDGGRIVHRGAMAELADDDALQHRLLGLSLGAHA